MPRTRSAPVEATPVQVARAEVEAARTTLAEWVAERTAAEAELASLEQRSGSEILDDPAVAAKLPKIMGELRDRIDIAARAIAAQQPRVTGAESRYLNAEADLLEEPVRQARAVLAEHQAKTTDLLKRLEEHEGPFVHESLLIQERIRDLAGPHSYELPKSVALEDQVAAAERPVLLLRALASGHDPREMVGSWGVKPAKVYPACVWGPDVLVPAPAYLRSVGRAAEELAASRRNLSAVEQLVADLEARMEGGEVVAATYEDWTLAPPKTVGEQLEAARRQAAELRERVRTATAAESVTV